MDFSAHDLGAGIIWYMVFLFSTTLHEAAHAFAALKMGDRTAYMGGQVTLDPIPHIRREPVGMVLVPILSLLASGFSQMIGWASAPYNWFWAERYPRKAAVMALAGPASNLILVLLAAAGLKIGILAGYFQIPDHGLDLAHIVTGRPDGISRAIAMTASIFFSLNLVLLLFNLLPLPPLDGSAALALILPPRVVRRYLDLMRQPMFSILGLVIAWQVFPDLFFPVLVWGLGWIHVQ